MKSPDDKSPLSGNERLDDALLREHARAGSGDDEAFLAGLKSALVEDSCAVDRGPTTKVSRRAKSKVWSLGLAATIALAAGLTLWGLNQAEQDDLAYQMEESPSFVVHQNNYAPPEPPPVAKAQRSVSDKKPNTPSGTMSKVITNTAPSPTSVPVPYVSYSGPSLEFGYASDFGAGWGASGNGAGFGGGGGDLTLRGSYEKNGKFYQAPVDREQYGQLTDNSWQTPIDHALSTFSIDVDTASYTNLRRMIMSGARIPKDAVRLEEMVNYFDYSYTPPTGEHPFAAHVGNAACPWNPDHQLVRVALKGREVNRIKRAPANLVFLMDVSGSMGEELKLPLMVRSFRLLLEELNSSDTISIVVYAGAQGLALPPTKCDSAGRRKISAVLDKLSSGGSTAGGAGIKLAYQLAKENFKPGGINRVILATDGDFNVGVTDTGSLVKLVEKNSESKVFLTVLGFGAGNLNDGMMEAITNKGDGTYHYLDGDKEARRVFLDKLMGTLVTIAKDVKIQVEFNPAQVKRYRLLGYANRMLKKEDFANDKVDAGDIGSGHTVTAFYEVEMGDGRKTPPAEKLRYQENEPEAPKVKVSDEWLTVKLRYKQPEGDESTLMEHPYIGKSRAFDEADADFRFGTSVAMTGMLLRETEGMRDSSFAGVSQIAAGSLGVDPHGQRAEFLDLIKRLAARQR